MPARPVSRTVPALTLLCLSLLVAVARPAQAQPLADRVPADALVYVGWQGAAHLGAGFDGSRTKALLESSGFPRIFAELLPVIIRHAEREEPEAVEALKVLQIIGRPMWNHPSAFYFAGVDFGGGFPRPKAALLCNAGTDAGALLEQANRLVQLAQQQGVPFPVLAAREGDLVVLSFGYDNVQQAIAGGQAANVRPLAGSDAFKAAMAQVLKEPAAVVYVDAEALLAQVDNFVAMAGDAAAKEQWPKVKEVLGLGGLKRLTWTGGFADGDWSTRALIAAPAPRKGLVGLLDSKPLSDEALKLIPRGATWCGAFQFDLAGLIARAREFLGQVDPNAPVNMDAALNDLANQLGFHPTRDLIEAIGPEWVIYVDPATGGNGPLGLTVVNRLVRPADVERSLGKLEQLLDAQVNQELQREHLRMTFGTTRAGNATIHYVQMPVISPSWAVADGNWTLGLYPQMVAEATAHVAAKGPSILDNADFVAARKRLVPEGAKVSAFTWMDLPKTSGAGYQVLLALSQTAAGFADMAGVKTPAMILPPYAQFRKSLSPAASFTWVDDGGWHFASSSPFPGAELLGMQYSPAAFSGALMAAGVAMPAMAQSRERAQRMASASNLRQIGMGCMLYANDHRGKYPTNMGPLVLEADLNPAVFFSPASGKKLPASVRTARREEQAAWVSSNADYVYLGHMLNANAPADMVLAYEKPEIHRGAGMNVLFNDGHVEWLPVARAMEMVRAQQQKQR